MSEQIEFIKTTIVKPEESNTDNFQVRTETNDGFIAGFGKTIEEAITDLADSLYKWSMPIDEYNE